MGMSVLVLAALVTSCGTEEAASDSTEASVATTSTSVGMTTEVPTAGTTDGPEPTNDSLLVVGDWGAGTLPQGAVAGAMAEYAEDHSIEAILTTGDNFYGDDIEFLMTPFEWAKQASLPFWITWGNHDVETELRIQGIVNVFDNPPRWGLFEWGNIDVIILDSNQVTSLDQAAFLLSTMAASRRPTIIALHHPPYSCSHQGSTQEVVDQWIGLLDDDVFLVLAGHEHSYQRFAENGINFVVTGGGGRTLRPLSECSDEDPTRLAGAELHHFLALSQEAGAVRLVAFDVNGAPFDEILMPFD